MTIKFTSKGLSMLQLLKKHGVSKGGFYGEWWANHKFASEKPRKGTYEITLDEKAVNQTYSQQKKGLTGGFEVANPALICELALSGNTEVKELMDKYWFRTSALTSVGNRVFVGFCEGRLNVGSWYDDFYDSGLGVAASRKFRASASESLETFDPLVPDFLQLKVSGKVYKYELIK